MATKAHLDANKRYLNKMYRIPVYVPQEQKGPLQEAAKAKGYTSLNSYVKHLLEKDTGLEL